MREIKFRAWLKVWDENEHVKGKMFYSILPTNNSLDEWIISFWDDGRYDGDFKVGEDILLMQYTGLKDKNGKEIYEGDIVKFESKLLDVKFSPYYGWTGSLMEGESFDGWEVIGNIYQDSHLLENENLLKG